MHESVSTMGARTSKVSGRILGIFGMHSRGPAVLCSCLDAVIHCSAADHLAVQLFIRKVLGHCGGFHEPNLHQSPFQLTLKGQKLMLGCIITIGRKERSEHHKVQIVITLTSRDQLFHIVLEGLGQLFEILAGMLGGVRIFDVLFHFVKAGDSDQLDSGCECEPSDRKAVTIFELVFHVTVQGRLKSGKKGCLASDIIFSVTGVKQWTQNFALFGCMLLREMNMIRDDIGHFVQVSQIGEAGNGVHSTIFKIIMNPSLAINQVVSTLERLNLGSFLAAVACFCTH